MLRAIPFFLALFALVLNISCGSTPSANTTESNNSNKVANNTTANVLASTPPATNTTATNRPANQNATIANATANNGPVMRTIKPGEKIPGIPDAATVKRQLSTPVDPSKLPPEFRRTLNAMANANANSNSNTARPTMMKKKP
ncbi:MAG: hypothetical protein ACRD43_06240 [Pyrinomonadaceae bacterium]